MSLENDLIFSLPPPAADPDGSMLRRMLHVHIAWLQARSARELALWVAVALSVVLWVCTHWPRYFPHRLHEMAIETWIADLGVLALAILVERWCWRMRARYLRNFAPTSTLPTP